MTEAQAVLADVTQVPGVRSAVLVDQADGIVIAERALEGQDTAAAAALSARLVERLASVTAAVGHPPLTLVLLQATLGQVFAASGGDGLILVAVAEKNANIGQVRLALLDAAGRLA